MAQIDLAKTAIGNIATPASTRASYAIDSNGAPLVKDSSGNLHYLRTTDANFFDATNFGFVGDDSTNNDAAWTVLWAAVTVGATVYFPEGTYRVSSEMTINADKHVRFLGAGTQQTTIKTTHATNNIFNISATAWYNTFEDMGFASSVTRTGGAAIYISSGSAIGTDVRRCAFTGMFYGIYASGAQSANVSVWDSLNMAAPAANGSQIKIDGSTINLVISNSTINCGAGGSAIAGTKCVEINQCGAVQILGSDIIGGINALHVNATGIVAAVFINNTFFDQSGGSTVKISGASSASRVKLVQCGIAAGTASTHAVEIASTGTGAAGTSTAQAAGVDIVDCDIYNTNASATGSGVLVNGAQDVHITGNRITGFAGSGGTGIQITPTISAGYTKFRISGNIIGPNENFTTGNETGIKLNAGSFNYGPSSCIDNIITGNTTPINDATTFAASSQKNINSNVGVASGLLKVTANNVATTTTVEAVVLQIPLPANSVKVGTTFRYTLVCHPAATTVTTCRVRIGTAGTNADAAVIVMSATALTNAATRYLTGTTSVNVSGASATHIGAGIEEIGTITTVGTAAAATGTFNTAVANFVSVTLQNTSTTTTTVYSGILEILDS